MWLVMSSGPGFKGESYDAPVAEAAACGHFRGRGRWGEVQESKWFGAVVTSQGLH